jgi:aminomethyltransferase
LKRSPLHGLHVEAGARFTAFAGYEMPLHYPAGIIQEHLHTRAQAGLFDISHMGQIAITGAARAAWLERLTPADLVDLRPGRQRYALLTNETGGIIDDVLIGNAGDHFLMVTNAAQTSHVYDRLTAAPGSGCAVEAHTDRALLALQGPAAAAVLSRHGPNLEALYFQDIARMAIAGIDCWVSRSGYTGEDGFEIALPASKAETLARHLLAEPEVRLIGLGARDTLRLEAGFCLYGQDIDETTTPAAASLGWTVARARRPGGARPGGFPGAAVILHELQAGPRAFRTGLLPDGKVPVRAGTSLVDAEDTEAGRITSGGYSPSLQRPIAMGYLRTREAQARQAIYAFLRGQRICIQPATLPFVPHRYCRKQI